MTRTRVAVVTGGGTGIGRVAAANEWAHPLSILGYLRFHRSGSRRWLAISVAASSVALLFYVKPVFIPLYLTREAGWTLAEAGLALSTGAVMWSAGSAVQARPSVPSTSSCRSVDPCSRASAARP